MCAQQYLLKCITGLNIVKGVHAKFRYCKLFGICHLKNTIKIPYPNTCPIGEWIIARRQSVGYLWCWHVSLGMAADALSPGRHQVISNNHTDLVGSLGTSSQESCHAEHIPRYINTINDWERYDRNMLTVVLCYVLWWLWLYIIYQLWVY